MTPAHSGLAPSAHGCFWPEADVPETAVAQITHACAVIQKHLAGTVLAVHLFGSAIDGGLKPFSDIDLLVTVGERPTQASRHAFARELLEVSAPPTSHPSLRPLEVTLLVHEDVVPWRYPPRRELQFGEWLREDLKSGIHEDAVLDPDVAILLTKARHHSIPLAGPDAASFFDPVPMHHLLRSLEDTMAQWSDPDDWAGDERNVVLALSRIWYTAATGKIASKDAAASWLLGQEQGPDRAVLAKARAAYLGQEQDDLADRRAEVASFVAGARQAISRLIASVS